MHPIERLRYVARAEGAGPTALVRAAAGALAGFADDPVGLVTACRRLVDRHPAVGPMWWLAARVMGAAEPDVEAWRVADELDEDPTCQKLAAEIQRESVVVVLGWSELVTAALAARGDVRILAVDTLGEGLDLVRRLRSVGSEVDEVPESGLGAAVCESDLVLLEASALGSSGFVTVPGSRAAASVARIEGVPVWVVAGAGRVLPARLWEALELRLDDYRVDTWNRIEEVVPLGLSDQAVGAAGRVGRA